MTDKNNNSIAETVDKYRVTMTVSTFVLVLLFIIVNVITLATWKTNMESEQIHLANDVAEVEVNMYDFEIKQDGIRISQAEIKTKLASKNKVKNHMASIIDKIQNKK